MITRTDDPIADFSRWDYEQASNEELLPTCDCCGDRITDDTFIRIKYKRKYINVCNDCAEECSTDEYVEERR